MEDAIPTADPVLGHDPSPKIYSELRMMVGVGLGGPLAAAIYLVRTLRAFEKPNIAVALAVILPLALLGLSFASPFVPALDRLPDPFFYLLQFGILLGFTRGYFLTELRTHLNEYKPVYSWGNTLLVSVISLLGTLLLFVPLILLSSNYDPRMKATYGNLKHEIYYDPLNITEPEIRRMGAALTTVVFFDEANQKFVEVSKSSNSYIISMYFSQEANQPETIESYRELRTEVQKEFPAHRIMIDMLVDSPATRIARLE